MNFQWMEEIPWLKQIKAWLKLRHRLGDILHWMPTLGLAEKPDGRPDGISVMMRLRNESRFIEAAIRSLAPFVEHFSIVDNGSTDGTPDIIRRVADELSLDVTLEILPTADFGEVCDRSLHNTKHKWVLRWDGDMIARTSGEQTLDRLREYIDTLDPDKYYAVYFPHIRLEGDLFHQDPDYLLHYEEWLFTYSPKLYHTPTGRFRETVYPVYYKRVYFWENSSFHVASLDNARATVIRKYWEPWRKLGDTDTYPTLESYALAHIRGDFGCDSLDDAGALNMRERFRSLVPYDEKKFGPYPDLLKPFLASIEEKIVYSEGRIAGRNDIMPTLDRLDLERMKMSVDVIVCTRGRRDLPVETVRQLLNQDYPEFRIIVIDQNDEPLDEIASLAEHEPRLIYHIAQTRGLPNGRNEGVELSSADSIIFLDDDIIPAPGLIKGHLTAYINDNIAGTAGKIIEKRAFAAKPVPRNKTGKVVYWYGEIYRGFTRNVYIDVDTSQGANMSFRRKALLEIGGFEPAYGGTSFFEETDVCLRLKKKGYRIRYTPDAELVHIGAAEGGCRIEDVNRLNYWYGHNFTLLFFRHFPMYTLPTFFMVRIGKFLRDCFVYKNPAPAFSGFRGMLDGYLAWRRGAQ